MKNIFRGLLVILSAFPIFVSAGDIVNGWSANTTIEKMHSNWTRTLFKLNGITDGCGHPDMWSLDMDESAASKAKLSMLIAAFTAEKTLKLRCENGEVTDFEILQ